MMMMMMMIISPQYVSDRQILWDVLPYVGL